MGGKGGGGGGKRKRPGSGGDPRPRVAQAEAVPKPKGREFEASVLERGVYDALYFFVPADHLNKNAMCLNDLEPTRAHTFSLNLMMALLFGSTRHTLDHGEVPPWTEEIMKALSGGVFKIAEGIPRVVDPSIPDGQPQPEPVTMTAEDIQDDQQAMRRAMEGEGEGGGGDDDDSDGSGYGSDADGYSGQRSRNNKRRRTTFHEGPIRPSDDGLMVAAAAAAGPQDAPFLTGGGGGGAQKQGGGGNKPSKRNLVIYSPYLHRPGASMRSKVKIIVEPIYKEWPGINSTIKECTVLGSTLLGFIVHFLNMDPLLKFSDLIQSRIKEARVFKEQSLTVVHEAKEERRRAHAGRGGGGGNVSAGNLNGGGMGLLNANTETATTFQNYLYSPDLVQKLIDGEYARMLETLAATKRDSEGQFDYQAATQSTREERMRQREQTHSRLSRSLERDAAGPSHSSNNNEETSGDHVHNSEDDEDSDAAATAHRRQQQQQQQQQPAREAMAAQKLADKVRFSGVVNLDSLRDWDLLSRALKGLGACETQMEPRRLNDPQKTYRIPGAERGGFKVPTPYQDVTTLCIFPHHTVMKVKRATSDSVQFGHFHRLWDLTPHDMHLILTDGVMNPNMPNGTPTYLWSPWEHIAVKNRHTLELDLKLSRHAPEDTPQVEKDRVQHALRSTVETIMHECETALQNSRNEAITSCQRFITTSQENMFPVAKNHVIMKGRGMVGQVLGIINGGLSTIGIHTNHLMVMSIFWSSICAPSLMYHSCYALIAPHTRISGPPSVGKTVIVEKATELMCSGTNKVHTTATAASLLASNSERDDFMALMMLEMPKVFVMDDANMKSDDAYIFKILLQILSDKRTTSEKMHTDGEGNHDKVCIDQLFRVIFSGATNYISSGKAIKNNPMLTRMVQRLTTPVMPPKYEPKAPPLEQVTSTSGMWLINYVRTVHALMVKAWIYIEQGLIPKPDLSLYTTLEARISSCGLFPAPEPRAITGSIVVYMNLIVFCAVAHIIGPLSPLIHYDEPAMWQSHFPEGKNVEIKDVLNKISSEVAPFKDELLLSIGSLVGPNREGAIYVLSSYYAWDSIVAGNILKEIGSRIGFQSSFVRRCAQLYNHQAVQEGFRREVPLGSNDMEGVQGADIDKIICAKTQTIHSYHKKEYDPFRHYFFSNEDDQAGLWYAQSNTGIHTPDMNAGQRARQQHTEDVADANSKRTGYQKLQNNIDKINSDLCHFSLLSAQGNGNGGGGSHSMNDDHRSASGLAMLKGRQVSASSSSSSSLLGQNQHQIRLQNLVTLLNPVWDSFTSLAGEGGSDELMMMNGFSKQRFQALTVRLRAVIETVESHNRLHHQQQQQQMDGTGLVQQPEVDANEVIDYGTLKTEIVMIRSELMTLKGVISTFLMAAEHTLSIPAPLVSSHYSVDKYGLPVSPDHTIIPPKFKGKPPMTNTGRFMYDPNYLTIEFNKTIDLRHVIASLLRSGNHMYKSLHPHEISYNIERYKETYVEHPDLEPISSLPTTAGALGKIFDRIHMTDRPMKKSAILIDDYESLELANKQSMPGVGGGGDEVEGGGTGEGNTTEGPNDASSASKVKKGFRRMYVLVHALFQDREYLISEFMKAIGSPNTTEGEEVLLGIPDRRNVRFLTPAVVTKGTATTKFKNPKYTKKKIQDAYSTNPSFVIGADGRRTEANTLSTMKYDEENANEFIHFGGRDELDAFHEAFVKKHGYTDLSCHPHDIAAAYHDFATHCAAAKVLDFPYDHLNSDEGDPGGRDHIGATE